jgi:hypothetical protein
MTKGGNTLRRDLFPFLFPLVGAKRPIRCAKVQVLARHFLAPRKQCPWPAISAFRYHWFLNDNPRIEPPANDHGDSGHLCDREHRMGVSAVEIVMIGKDRCGPTISSTRSSAALFGS